MDYKLRIIIAIAVSFIILITWQLFFNKNKKQDIPVVDSSVAAETSAAEVIDDTTAIVDTATLIPVQDTASRGGETVYFEKLPENSGFVMENENLTISLDLENGASVAGIILHDYGISGSEKMLSLYPLNDSAVSQKGLIFYLNDDSLKEQRFNSFAVPFILDTAYIVSDTQVFVFSQNILRVTESEFLDTVSVDTSITAVMDTSHESVYIRYMIPPEGYSFHVSAWTDFSDRMRYSWSMAWYEGMAVTEPDVKSDPGKNRFFVAMSPTGFRYFRKSLKDVADGKVLYEEPAFWAGVADQYFMIAFIPRNDDESDFHSPVKFVSYANDDDFHPYQTDIHFGPTRSDTVKFICYTGPLDETHLLRTGFHLDENVQMGWRWLRPISKTLLWFLRLLNKVVPNYGLDIIIFSLAMNVVFLPLSLYSQKSMKRMQDLQPKLQELKDKYKGDPKRLNEETMKMYRQEAFNPFSGCLPLLLQMPVFMALYQIMKTTIILRNQSFLWIPDLSRPEATIPFSLPFTSAPGIGILPLLMGVMMFFQQKMTNTNPQQKSLTYIMPIFMTYIFLGFPAAIVLYWASYNLFGLGQQLFFKYREKLAKEQRAE